MGKGLQYPNFPASCWKTRIIRICCGWRGPRLSTLLNIRAFLATAEVGSLSGAARRLNVSPSVITKRVARLEDEMQVTLFNRTTRKVELTEVGRIYVERYREILRQLDSAVVNARQAVNAVEGSLRIKCPTTLAASHLGRLMTEFLSLHPELRIELILLDRSVNPIEEGFDIAFGALPISYPNVHDVDIAEYHLMLCSTQSYLASHPPITRPADLVRHDCLTMRALGSTWTFNGPNGPMAVNVDSRFAVNDSDLLRHAVARGFGITMVGEYLVREDLASGRLVHVLPDYPTTPLWLKAMVPAARMNMVSVKALLAFVREHLEPVFEKSNEAR
ncbi:LysR family transcriptional regulator [Aurantiacibacter flavus]|uniref:LysR family transcriptional regulator n=1 Tax=Aurantiacibacter flavus TaxID=3145232 RepID=A0ABV0D034_9SPHN